jgi:hypothetical protein
VSVRDDFTGVKDSVVMGDVNQNFSVEKSESFDELVEKVISYQDPKERADIFRNNELEMLKGLTEIISLAGENWADLKDFRFDRFVLEIFDSELRNSVLGTKLRELSLDKNLKDMQYLWHLSGVFTGGDSINSVKELINCVESMKEKTPGSQRYYGFLTDWWWGGEDNKHVLEHIFSTFTETNVKQLYELCKEYRSFQFNEFIICYLYSLEWISEEYRTDLGVELELMINDTINSPLSGDLPSTEIFLEYGLSGAISIALTRMAFILDNSSDLYEAQNQEHELNEIQKMIDEFDRERTISNRAPIFSDIDVYANSNNLRHTIQQIKDKCTYYPLIDN